MGHPSRGVAHELANAVKEKVIKREAKLGLFLKFLIICPRMSEN